MLFTELGFNSNPCTATGASPVAYTTTDIPECKNRGFLNNELKLIVATATAFTVSFWYASEVYNFPTSSNDFVFLFQLSNQSTE